MACRADLSALDLHNLTAFLSLVAAPATSSGPEAARAAQEAAVQGYKQNQCQRAAQEASGTGP